MWYSTAAMKLVFSLPAPNSPANVTLAAGSASRVRESAWKSKPRKSLLVTKFTTPATGSDPNIAEPPSSNSSARCTAMRGTSELMSTRFQPVPSGAG